MEPLALPPTSPVTIPTGIAQFLLNWWPYPKINERGFLKGKTKQKIDQILDYLTLEYGTDRFIPKRR